MTPKPDGNKNYKIEISDQDNPVYNFSAKSEKVW